MAGLKRLVGVGSGLLVLSLPPPRLLGETGDWMVLSGEQPSPLEILKCKDKY